MSKPIHETARSELQSGETNFRAHFLQALVVVLTVMSILFGLMVSELIIGLILIACHILISVFLSIAIARGVGKRRDFALVCIIPNVAGYVFAIGGIFGWERWLLISLSIFCVLGMTGLSRRLMALTFAGEENAMQRIPIVGRWFGPGKDSSKFKPGESVDQMFDDEKERRDVPEGENSRNTETVV